MSSWQIKPFIKMKYPLNAFCLRLCDGAHEPFLC